MKELRFDAADGVWRFAFAFDPARKAIILCGGDKSGGSQKRFYRQLIDKSIKRSSTGERVFCGSGDDPFFVDLGGIFDLGDAPRTTGTAPRDGVKCKNVSVIAMQIDISTLQKNLCMGLMHILCK